MKTVCVVLGIFVGLVLGLTVNRLIGRLCCWWGKHAPPKGWNPAFSAWCECTRPGCRQLLTGRLGGGR